jgi:hypothetical protein
MAGEPDGDITNDDKNTGNAQQKAKVSDQTNK